MPAISGYSSPSAVAGDIMNFVDVQEQRESRIALAREKERERQSEIKQKNENFDINSITKSVKWDNLDPMYKTAANNYLQEAISDVADAYGKQRSNQDMKPVVNEKIGELGQKLSGLYNNTKQLRGLLEQYKKNPDSVNPDMMHFIDNYVQANGDEDAFERGLIKIPNVLKSWDYNPDTRGLTITPKGHLDPKELNAQVDDLFKKIPITGETEYGTDEHGNIGYAPLRNPEMVQQTIKNLQTVAKPDTPLYNTLIGWGQYNNPDIYVNGITPVSEDGSLNPNATIDPKKAQEFLNNAIQQKGESMAHGDFKTKKDWMADDYLKYNLWRQKEDYKQAHGGGSNSKTEAERAFDKMQAPISETLGNLKTKLADEKAAITAVAQPTDPKPGGGKEQVKKHEENIKVYQDELDKTQKEYDKQVNNWALMQKYDMTDDERVQLVKKDPDDLKEYLKDVPLKKDGNRESSNKSESKNQPKIDVSDLGGNIRQTPTDNSNKGSPVNFKQ